MTCIERDSEVQNTPTIATRIHTTNPLASRFFFFLNKKVKKNLTRKKYNKNTIIPTNQPTKPKDKAKTQDQKKKKLNLAAHLQILKSKSYIYAASTPNVHSYAPRLTTSTASTKSYPYARKLLLLLLNLTPTCCTHLCTYRGRSLAGKTP
ncbi:unnamed protein product [Camellia sinensis]